MRLTNSDREAFIASAMDDVPKRDYSTEARNIVLNALRAVVPAELQKMIVKYDEWFGSHRVNMPTRISDFHTKLVKSYIDWDKVVADEKQRELIRDLAREAKAQDEARDALKSKLRAAIFSCTTLKQALELMPEFAKYLPAERDGVVTRSMPAIANLVADLTAAGWPKGKKNAKAPAA